MVDDARLPSVIPRALVQRPSAIMTLQKKIQMMIIKTDRIVFERRTTYSTTEIRRRVMKRWEISQNE